MGKELEGGLVRPMQIFDHDHDRPLAREVTEKSGEGRMEPVAIDRNRGRIGWSDRERGHAVRGAGDVHERTERPARINLSALAPENPCALRACLLGEVAEHSRLAYAGLAGHEGGPAPAA